MHSLNLLAHMAPPAAGLLLLISLVAEPGAVAAASNLIKTHARFAPLLALNCLFAAGVNLTNFLVTRATSALTLQVLGKAKSVVAVVISVLIFGNPISVLGLTGYAICLGGVAAYTRSKTQKLKRKTSGAAEEEEKGGQSLLPLHAPSGPAR